MKVELKEIIDQLTEAVGLEEGYKVASLVDDDGNTLLGWCIVKAYEDGRIAPVKKKKNGKSRTYKDLKDLFKHEYKS